MRRKDTLLRMGFSAVCAVALIVSTHTVAQPQLAALPVLDKRLEQLPLEWPVTGDQAAAVTHLKERVPGASVEFHRVAGSPRWISAREGFLSGPTELEILRQGDLGLAKDDPHRAIKAFLIDNAGLYGHGADVLAKAVVKRDYVRAHNGLRTVVLEQQLDDIPVLGTGLGRPRSLKAKDSV